MRAYGGPLEGVVVLDLTHFIAGPYGTQYLADLGADVVKIEPPDGGDMGRGAGTDFVEGESLHFFAVNKNKRSVVLDLKQPDGLAAFRRMVERADVVFDNFRPGVLERLGVDYEALSAVNPRIICTSVSAFGQYGPRRELPGYDLAIQALSGVMSLTGETTGNPVRCGVPIGDLVGGVIGALGTVSALYARERTGRGRRVDVSLFDAQVSLLMYWSTIFLGTGKVPGRVGAGHPTIVPYGQFKTKDSYLVLAVFGDRFFQSLCTALGLDELAADERLATNPGRVARRDLVERAVGGVFAQRTTAEWLEVLQAAGIPCAPVNDVGQALADEQVAARDMVISVDHPLAGALRLLGNPVKTADSRRENLPPPLLGEHTAEVLRELAGFDQAEVDDLDRRGVTRPVGARHGAR